MTEHALKIPDASPPELRRETTLPHTRIWFATFLLWMAALAATALWAFQYYEAGNADAMHIWILALLAFYLSLCNAFVPLPTAWIIMFAASPELALFEAGSLRVTVVALVGALATVAANLNEYHLLAYFFRFGIGTRLRDTRIYRWAIRWFSISPFQILTLIGFIPIPIDAIRWLAVLNRYSRIRFAAAYFIGRGARYALLAWFSVLLQLGTIEILMVQAAIVLLALLSRLALRVMRKSQTSAPQPVPHTQQPPREPADPPVPNQPD